MTIDKRIPSILTAVLFLGTAATFAQSGGMPGKDTLLVIPARHTIVQFAFDIAAMRPVQVVSYEGDVDEINPLMHVWNRDIRKWEKISVEGYASGSVFAELPRTAVVIGSERDIPAVLENAPQWSEKVVRIETLDLVTIVNELNRELQLTAREWARLSKRYGLQLKDLNYERRRYGRYGPPGGAAAEPPPLPMPEESEKLAPMPVEEKGVPSQAEQEAEPAAPETVPEDK